MDRPETPKRERRRPILNELAGMPLDRQRQLVSEAAKAVRKDANGELSWGLLLSGLYFLFACPTAMYLAAALGRSLPGKGMPDWVAAATGLVAALLTGVWLAAFIDRRLRRRHVWRLAPHLCDDCGYNLTSNTSGVCPECGRRVNADKK